MTFRNESKKATIYKLSITHAASMCFIHDDSGRNVHWAELQTSCSHAHQPKAQVVNGECISVPFCTFGDVSVSHSEGLNHERKNISIIALGRSLTAIEAALG